MSFDSRSIKEHLTARNSLNRKPYRTATQKTLAKRTARIVDGRFVSAAPVSRHHLRPRPSGGV